jgi:hypothetical protein
VAAEGAEQVDFGQIVQQEAEARGGVHAPTGLRDFVTNPGNTLNYAADQAAGSIFPMGASMVSAILGGPVVGAVAMGGTTAGQSFGQYRSEGHAYEQAAPAALVQGAEEAAFEAAPLVAALKPGVAFAKRLAHTAFSEGWSEFLTQLAQDKSEASMLDKEPLSVGQALTNAFTAALAGGGTGANMAVIGHAATRTLDRVREKAQAKQERTFVDGQVEAALAS